MQNNYYKFLVLFSCMLASNAGFAESTADNLTRIEAETTVLKAQAKKLEAKAQIATKQAEIDRLTGTASIGDPRVRSVEGIGNIIYATLQLENGSTLDVKAGDMLPKGMKVLSVRANEVVVQTHNGKRIRLDTGTPSSVAYKTGSVSGSALPSLPPFSPGAMR